MTFPAGEYDVPTDISDFLAQRCLRSGRAIVIEDDAESDPLAKKRAPSNKMQRRAPENKSFGS